MCLAWEGPEGPEDREAQGDEGLPIVVAAQPGQRVQKVAQVIRVDPEGLGSAEERCLCRLATDGAYAILRPI